MSTDKSISSKNQLFKINKEEGLMEKIGTTAS